MAGQRQRSGGGLHAVAGIDIVLEQDRHAVQGAAQPPGGGLGVAFGGDRRSIAIALDDRPRIPVARPDGGQETVHRRRGGDPATLDECGDVAQAEKRRIGAGHLDAPPPRARPGSPGAHRR